MPPQFIVTPPIGITTDVVLIELRGGRRTALGIGRNKLPRGSEVVGHTQVDARHAKLISQYSWCRRSGRASSRIGDRLVQLHHLVYLLECGKPLAEGEEIDHRDRDGLNNTAGNLRLASRRLNTVNRGRNRNNVSGYSGVHFLKHRSIWQSAIWLNYKKIHLGSFATKEDAARAVNAAYRQHYPGIPIPNPSVDDGKEFVLLRRADRYGKPAVRG